MKQTEFPIGIFDSGIGGLSVLRHIREQLPKENLLYFADSGFAPYGEKPESAVIERVMKISHYLLSDNCKALVVACNTATAAAIHLLREKYPNVPIIGIEPGLKPATALTKSRIVGVLATERTLKSNKFKNLKQRLTDQTGVKFIIQACPGLADLIEKNELYSARTKKLLRHFIYPLIEQNADTIVLGCTHYPFVQTLIEEILAESGILHTRIIDTGIAVTRQLIRLLNQDQLLQKEATARSGVHALTTGNATLLSRQFEQLLQIRPDITAISI